MLKIHGKLYYIDFEVIDNFLSMEDGDVSSNIQKTETITRIYNEENVLLSTESTEEDNIKHKEINGVRFEIIRNFIEDLASGDTVQEDYDDKLGSRNLTKMSTRFKLAFNTLLFYNILRKLD